MGPVGPVRNVSVRNVTVSVFVGSVTLFATAFVTVSVEGLSSHQCYPSQ